MEYGSPQAFWERKGFTQPGQSPKHSDQWWVGVGSMGVVLCHRAWTGHQVFGGEARVGLRRLYSDKAWNNQPRWVLRGFWPLEMFRTRNGAKPLWLRAHACKSLQCNLTFAIHCIKILDIFHLNFAAMWGFRILDIFSFQFRLSVRFQHCRPDLLKIYLFYIFSSGLEIKMNSLFFEFKRCLCRVHGHFGSGALFNMKYRWRRIFRVPYFRFPILETLIVLSCLLFPMPHTIIWIMFISDATYNNLDNVFSQILMF